MSSVKYKNTDVCADCSSPGIYVLYRLPLPDSFDILFKIFKLCGSYLLNNIGFILFNIHLVSTV